VTLEGEFVDAAGILGGARSLAQGAVGRRSSAPISVTRSMSSTCASKASMEQRLEIAAERTKLQKEWERSSQELEARRQSRAQAESALATARARLRDLEAARVLSSTRAERWVAETQRLESELETRRAELAAAASGIRARERRAVRARSSPT